MLILTTQFEIALAFGAIGALLMVVSNLMKRMVWLRVFALTANAFFIIQFAITHNWILVGLQVTLLSINVWRLWSLRRLLLSLEAVNADSSIRDWLLPQMKKRKFKAGTTLFRKGDFANELIYIQSGTIQIVEIGRQLGPGSLIGEIGIFSAEHLRTASVVCETDVVAYTMTDEAAYLLYEQNPQIGFYLIRLVIQQLSASSGLAATPVVSPGLVPTSASPAPA